jgi:hypothetical protein
MEIIFLQPNHPFLYFIVIDFLVDIPFVSFCNILSLDLLYAQGFGITTLKPLRLTTVLDDTLPVRDLHHQIVVEGKIIPIEVTA